MPIDCQLQNLQDTRPDIYANLTEGIVAANKNLDFLHNRAIWYHELDARHVFNRKFPRCRASNAMVRQALWDENGQDPADIPQLQIDYTVACEEYEGWTDSPEEPFRYREHFLRQWQESVEDIWMPSRGETSRYAQMVNDLAAALPTATGEPVTLPEETDERAPYRPSADRDRLGDVEMLDTDELQMGGQAYTEQVGAAQTDEGREKEHGMWVMRAIYRMEQRVRFMIERGEDLKEPLNQELALNYYAKISALKDDEETRVRLKQMGM